MKRKNQKPLTPYQEARRIYLQSMIDIGFTFLRLHKVKPNGECGCSPLSSTRNTNKAKKRLYFETRVPNPCTNPGKHIVSSAGRSVIKSIRKIEKHLDAGGSIGISMRMKTLPGMPLRLVCLDCDQVGAAEWLAQKGITSPLEVFGKRGRHIYLLLPDSCPDLLSDTRSLNAGKDFQPTEEKPGIDIKVSGLIVAPYSVNKRLYYNGRDISAAPEEVKACFASIDSLKALLPIFDPRSIAPRMREFHPPLPARTTTQGTCPPAAPRLQTSSPRQPSGIPGQYRSTLSTERISRVKGTGDSRELPYHYRKGLAKHFLRKTRPSREGQNPTKDMFRVVCTIIKHYWLSEMDAFDLIDKFYNPRCVDEEGESYPYEEKSLVHMINAASRPEMLNPIGLKHSETWAPVPLERMVAVVARRDSRANARRKKRAQTRRLRSRRLINDFLVTQTRCGNPSLTFPSFRHLLAVVNKRAVETKCAPMSPKYLSVTLHALGYSFDTRKTPMSLARVGRTCLFHKEVA